MRKRSRKVLVNFGSVGADAGHDVFLTVEYNPLSNCGYVRAVAINSYSISRG